MLTTFSVSRLPQVLFGDGVLARVPGLAAAYGRSALLVIGSRSLRDSAHWAGLLEGLRRQNVEWEELRVESEPSPQLVDEAVRHFHQAGIEVVIGIGGGSVLDAAKAIAGLLQPGNSVMDHLEGIGPELPYRGPATPYIAVPTTAGTGSEATKNAVLSLQGPGGFKKSFRHDLLVARYAVIDPQLLASCPPSLIAANGMDALTQLIESYVSTRANPFTDALSLSGLEAVRDGLLEWYEQGPRTAEARGQMAYAALLSGITLAQAGLGSVHGLASPLGALFPIPHGVVCGTLVAAATGVNIQALREREPQSSALDKYAHLGRLLSRQPDLAHDAAWQVLVATLKNWTERMRLPGLRAYAIGEGDFATIVANCRGSSMKTNPIVLTDSEVTEILAARF